MNFVWGCVIVLISLGLGVWWWRRNYVPSPLDQHYADLAARAQVGAVAQRTAFLAQPMAAMVGSGWGTTMMINPTNPNGVGNQPGKLRLGMRFVQPGGF